MHGPQLTVAEIAELLARQVSQVVALGTTRLHAIDIVARRHGIERAVVDRLVARHDAPSGQAAA
jgi:hypothetical protein